MSQVFPSPALPIPSQPLVWVVDDDPDLCELLDTYLSANGYRVHTMRDGVALRAALGNSPMPDVIVMDLMLPGEDGLALTRMVKAQQPTIPILILSAKGEEMDRVIGLEVGADDYLPKPFGPRELLARLRALLRRQLPLAQTAADATPAPREALPALTFGPFVLEIDARRLWRDHQDIPLTSAEFDLLLALARRPYRVLTRDQLVELLKGFERDPFDRSMDNRVTRLRRKLEPDPTHPVYIRTVRGEGYLFNPQGHLP